MVPIDKLTGFLIIDTKIMVAHMLCRSAAVGINNPTTSAIFTMCRSPPNGQRHECRIVERQIETSHIKMSSTRRCLNAARTEEGKNDRYRPFPLFPGLRGGGYHRTAPKLGRTANFINKSKDKI